MFELKKVIKARKILNLVTSFLFKLFQIRLNYKEKRPDYGIEIFEYFYLPWRSDTEFTNFYNVISEYTLNPTSRLYSIFDLSKRHLLPNTTFIEVGCWRGGTAGLIALANKDKNVDFILCDTFDGVVNASTKDSFFKGNEYSNATYESIKKLENKINYKLKVVQGIFPESIKSTKIIKPISFAHIDVDTYISAKESLEFILENSTKGTVIVLDDYGGWFTDGVTMYGNELKLKKDLFVVPNHLGQLVIYKIK